MKLLTIAVVLLASPISRSTHATVVEYGLHDRAAWFEDVGGSENVSTVDFTGYNDFTPITDQWASLGVHFSGFVVTSGESFIFYPNDGWGVRGEPDINMRFDEPINWIAADFPGYTTVELYNNDELIYTSSIWGLGGFGRFGGLVSDESFDRVRFFEADNFSDVLDNVHFGPPIAVPAPATFACISICLIFSRRRRRFVADYRD